MKEIDELRDIVYNANVSSSDLDEINKLLDIVESVVEDDDYERHTETTNYSSINDIQSLSKITLKNSYEQQKFNLLCSAIKKYSFIELETRLGTLLR